MLRFGNKRIDKGHAFACAKLENGNYEVTVALAGDWQSREMLVTEKELKEMLAYYQKDGKDILFDYDHNSLWGESKAAGWGKNLRIEDGKIIAELVPTESGRKAIEDKEYMYLSPVYEYKRRNRVTGKTENDWRLISVALTNVPFLEELPAILQNKITMEDNAMDWWKELGYESEEQALAALKTQKGELEQCKADLQSRTDELAALTTERDSLKEANGNLQAQINSQEVDKAIAEKKILPAQKDLALKLINSNRELYDDFVKNAAGNANGLTTEQQLNAATGDGLKDPRFADVHAFSDLLKDNDLNAAFKAAYPEEWQKLYNAHMTPGRKG